MWKPTNLMEALLPIFVLDWIFYHGVIHYKSVNKLKLNHSLLYSAITFIVYISFMIFFLVNPNFLETKTTLSSQTTEFLRITCFILLTIHVIVGWIFKNKAIKLNSDIIKADKTLENFGIKINIQREFGLTLKIAFLWLLFSVMSSVFTTCTDHRDFEILTKIVIVITILHGFHFIIIMDLRFSLLVRHMKLRFEHINKILQTFLKKRNLGLLQFENNERWVTFVGTRFEINLLHNIRCIHLELYILCRDITIVYGTSTVLTSIGSLVFSVYCFFHLWVFFIITNPTMYDCIIMGIAILVWLLPLLVSFFSINHICEETINEWRETGVILSKLELETKDSVLKEEIRNFAAQVYRNSLKFSAGGLINLSHRYIKDSFAVAATYTMVLIQTYPRDIESNL